VSFEQATAAARRRAANMAGLQEMSGPGHDKMTVARDPYVI
jgi:hypothetical protein